MNDNFNIIAWQELQMERLCAEIAALRKHVEELKSGNDLLKFAANQEQLRAALLEAENKRLLECNKHFRIELAIESPYCPTCGACGVEGCCPPDRCKELGENLKCLYGIDYAQDYKQLCDENEELRQQAISGQKAVEAMERIMKVFFCDTFIDDLHPYSKIIKQYQEATCRK